MTDKKGPTKGKRPSDLRQDGLSAKAASGEAPGAPPALLDSMREAASLVLTPGSALALLTRLIGEVPAASKETIDRLKLLDKLLNTARAMMETRLKTEEVAEVAARIDELELRLERMALHESSNTCRPREVWHDDTGDK